jgi:hypothetical protein
VIDRQCRTLPQQGQRSLAGSDEPLDATILIVHQQVDLVGIRDQESLEGSCGK